MATNAAGDAIFAVLIGLDLRGYFLTTTATNPQGSTSEFSACLLVQ